MMDYLIWWLIAFAAICYYIGKIFGENRILSLAGLLVAAAGVSGVCRLAGRYPVLLWVLAAVSIAGIRLCSVLQGEQKDRKEGEKEPLEKSEDKIKSGNTGGEQ